MHSLPPQIFMKGNSKTCTSGRKKEITADKWFKMKDNNEERNDKYISKSKQTQAT